MDDKPLPYPVELSFGGTRRRIESVRQAYDFLTTEWPKAARSPLHRDAVAICLKILDGHRSAVEAREAIDQAAQEAGIAVAWDAASSND